MIKIIVDTQEELNTVRDVLLSQACMHLPKCTMHTHVDCAECVDKYCENKVLLYTKEIVEIPAPVVV